MDELARQAADEAECRQTEQLLSRVTGYADRLITQCSRDLRYLFANELYADFLGRPLELIIGHSIPEVIGEAAFEVIRPHVDRVLAGERVEYEADIPYAGAGLRHVQVAYVPGFDLKGTVCGWIAMIDEITDRRIASAACELSGHGHMRAAWPRVCGAHWGGWVSNNTALEDCSSATR